MSRVFFISLLMICAAGPAFASPARCAKEIQRGIASWYGPGFEGTMTQNEEAFNPASLSAAHPTLPFGTLVKVTNMRNSKSVLVRVNDRGQFSRERVIDISQTAAQKIGMIKDGIAAVSISQCSE